MWLRTISTLVVTTMRCVKLLVRLVTNLQTQAPNEFTPQALQALQFSNHIEKEVFMDMVAKAKKLIREGDMFQCVLSQRFSADFEGDPWITTVTCV